MILTTHPTHTTTTQSSHPPAWRSRLNAGPLASALAAAKTAVGPDGHAPFKARVSKAAVPDYGKYVAPAREMWLDRIKGKLERGE